MQPNASLSFSFAIFTYIIIEINLERGVFIMDKVYINIGKLVVSLGMIKLTIAIMDKGIELVKHTVILAKEVKEYNKEKGEA
jgi:hypothetical protein